MLTTIATIIGIGLAYAAHRWRAASTVLALGQQGIEILKSTGLDHRLPENVRKVAEDAILAARQKEIDALAEKLAKLHAQSEKDEQTALERARTESEQAKAEGMQVEIVPPDGTEVFSSPWKDKPQ